jgi:hypothetical protein
MEDETSKLHHSLEQRSTLFLPNRLVSFPVVPRPNIDDVDQSISGNIAIGCNATVSNYTFATAVQEKNTIIGSDNSKRVQIGGINIIKFLFDLHHMIDLLEHPSICKHPIRLCDHDPPEFSFMRRFMCCKLPDILIALCNEYLEY